MDKIYKCSIICNFRVKGNFKEYIPNPTYSEDIVGFILPDGRTVRPIIGLEVESKDGTSFKDVTTQKGMDKLGLILERWPNSSSEYEKCFEEDTYESEKLEQEEYENMPIENLPANLEPRFPETRAIIERRLKERK